MMRFTLDWGFQTELRKQVPNFGYNGFGEFLFYRTYSRPKENGTMESWADVVVRVTEGIFSIRKDYCFKNALPWNESYWQKYSIRFAKSLFNMEWMPPGRGLWAMGSNYMYERGSMCLYNCAFVQLTENLHNELAWLMDCLMCGVGVGFGISRTTRIKVQRPKVTTNVYVIPDSKEGWVESVRRLIQGFGSGLIPRFDYSKIRPAGQPIKGFGGIASGPDSLRELHENISNVFSLYLDYKIDAVALQTDLANLIGCCVVSGNVRRSAEIGLCSVNDPVFLDLKNYDKFSYRSKHGWMSNNSVILDNDSDFERLSEISERVVKNGEPGYINLRNFKHARIGRDFGVYPVDKAIGINPCGEIPLESYEVCNLAETCPTRCSSFSVWLQACEYAAFYCSTVTLLATHQPETNAVVSRNRRIGVSIVDITGWIEENSQNFVTRAMRMGYKKIREINAALAKDVGIPPSLRVTTIKPGGTIPKLVGKTSGIGYPNCSYTLRRVRVAENAPITKILTAAGVPHEKDLDSKNTMIFEFPILQGPSRPVKDVTIWQQAMNIVWAQHNWADNAVSNTIMFKDSEVQDIEPVLSSVAPHTKSLSLLPIREGVYKQMPEESISREEYDDRLSKMQKIDWENYREGMKTESDRYCDGDVCEIK